MHPVPLRITPYVDRCSYKCNAKRIWLCESWDGVNNHCRWAIRLRLVWANFSWWVPQPGSDAIDCQPGSRAEHSQIALGVEFIGICKKIPRYIHKLINILNQDYILRETPINNSLPLSCTFWEMICAELNLVLEYSLVSNRFLNLENNCTLELISYFNSTSKNGKETISLSPDTWYQLK